MSGIVALFHKDGREADPSAVGLMMAALNHRGIDGSRTQTLGPACLGHQHFRTTPEEEGEEQPLVDPHSGLGVVFEGRLDNRDELEEGLGIKNPGSAKISDANMLLLAYKRWGEECFERAIGSFATALYDPRRRRLVCARDAVGNRTLYYHLNDRFIALGSEEQAVLAHPGISREPDEHRFAQYFAIRDSFEGRTYFRDVQEVPPAHVLSVTPRRVAVRRYWAPNQAPLDGLSDTEYADRFRSLLTASVKATLRSTTDSVVAMSGGLDSTSVTALAARHRADSGRSQHLPVISYVFNELKPCDERRYMATMTARYPLSRQEIVGDGCWPLRDIKSWPRNPNSPEEAPYRLLQRQVYRCARQAGCRTILTGGFSDHLYTSVDGWLADLLADRRYGDAKRQFFECARTDGWYRTLRRPSVQRALGAGWLRLRRRRRPRWLTTDARRLSSNGDSSSEQFSRRPAQQRRVLGDSAADSASRETFHANKEGTEVRQPFRDRRLIEFMLAVPAHQLYQERCFKYVLRNAMRGILPDLIRNRRRPTSLQPLFLRGIFEREAPLVRDILEDPQANWPRFVRRDWMSRAIEGHTDSGVEAVVLWRCLTFEIWRKRERISL